MESVKYFRKDDILSIKFNPITESGWKFYEAVPAIKGWFGRIIKKEVPAGYKRYECSNHILPEEEMKTFDYGFLKDKVHYNYPTVDIYLKDGYCESKRFKTDEEALRYAECIAKESGINFIRL